jgi:hypothetical protein
MPAPLNPQLDPTLTGIDVLAAAGRPQPNPGIDALAAVGQPQPNPQLAQAGSLSGELPDGL